MQKVFFTADLHLGHKKIIEHCHRPFSSVEEMDETILSNINAGVSPADRLYILGDFTMGGAQAVKSYRDRINCKSVHLVLGNHDSLSQKQYNEMGFFCPGYMDEVKVQGQSIVLCHYAMRRWNKSHHGSWCLYGHSHGCLFDDPILLSFDVGVDCHEYSPLSFEQVTDIMSKRTLARAEANH